MIHLLQKAGADGGPSGQRHQWLRVQAGKRPLRARYLPGEATPLMALHGISRDAEGIWKAFLPHAQSQGRALLVPGFDASVWPHFQRIDTVRPDLPLLDLLREAGLAGRKIDLFGYSGGAQLAHRLAMLYPHRVARLHIAAPGWFCLPDTRALWPEGLAKPGLPGLRKFDPAALSRLQLPAYLALPVRIWVGAEDNQRDAALRQSPDLDRLQGLTRIDRAHAYAEAFTRAARALGITPDIDVTLLPGCGHDFTKCANLGGLAARVTL
jgi:pimeloyl-ACP methyl ester carboxylesterase